MLSRFGTRISDDASDVDVKRELDATKVAVVKFVRRQMRKGALIPEAWKKTARELDADLKGRAKGTDAPSA